MLELEVQDCNNNHWLKVIVPLELAFIPVLSLLPYELFLGHPSLTVDGIGRVVQSTLPEMLLISLLHLNDEALSVLTLT